MSVKSGTIKTVVSYANEFNDDKAAEEFDITIATVKRYRRAARKRKISVGVYSIPKILLFDLETSPREYYAWRPRKQYIHPDRMIKDSAILTYAAKWLCGSKIISERVTLEEAHNREDKAICKKLWALLDEADIIIAHNLKRFDEPYAKTRFLVNDIDQPSPYRRIDTYAEIRKQFKFPSNSQGWLTKKFGINEKIDTDFELWEGCVNYDSESMDKMVEYNKQDVRGLEDLYFKIRGWIKNHPNLALYYNDIENRCPNCGSKDLNYRGHYHTNVNEFDALKCNECGAYMRDRHTNLSEDDKRDLYRGTVR